MSSSNVAASSEKLRANREKPRAMGLVTFIFVEEWGKLQKVMVLQCFLSRFTVRDGDLQKFAKQGGQMRSTFCGGTSMFTKNCSFNQSISIILCSLMIRCVQVKHGRCTPV